MSAFLKPVTAGASFELIRFSKELAFELYLSDDILEETARVLLRPGRMRQRYKYPDTAVIEFCKSLDDMASLVADVPQMQVVRDPTDDMIVACAVAAGADYLITRDKDLLSLGSYEGIAMIKPEHFLHVLRSV